jgi:extracellular elastinolytic metalloproteinase
LGCAVPFDNAAAIVGKIAVIDRGGTGCTFILKIKNAQNAGAIGVLVINNTTAAPTAMTGTDNSITIPAFMIGQTNGNSLKAQLTAGQTVNVTFAYPATAYQPDGDFDNGIIAHEYGHGWSIRLSGGPANSSCLGNTEQMGEGWSDFLGLMLTTNWSAQTATTASANVARGIGTYALGQPITGVGIRPFPYSYNKAAVNNTVTYSAVANTSFSAPHGIGSIWCTMLWDMAWEIIFQDGVIVNDIYNTSNLVGKMNYYLMENINVRFGKLLRVEV